jgi:molybdenum cofactor biosynthesis enzyme MoaA
MKLPLSVLLTKKCQAACKFCIEKPKKYGRDLLKSDGFIYWINKMIDRNMVSNILLLGGEPTLFPNIIPMIDNIKLPSILTTNGEIFIKNGRFRKNLIDSNLEALNISIHHYKEHPRHFVTGAQLFSNLDLYHAISDLTIKQNRKITINTLLIKDYIDSMEKITKMINFVGSMGLTQIKFARLTGDKQKYLQKDIHSFIESSKVQIDEVNTVIEKNRQHNGRILWKIYKSVKVYLQPVPKDTFTERGYAEHRILFNDGMIGHSWNRDDGVVRIEEYMRV